MRVRSNGVGVSRGSGPVRLSGPPQAVATSSTTAVPINVLIFIESKRTGDQHGRLDFVTWRRRLRREILTGIDEAVALQAVLLVVQLAIAAIQCDQLAMRASLDDLALFQHKNLISAFYGR